MKARRDCNVSWQRVCRDFRGSPFLTASPVVRSPEPQLLVLRHSYLKRAVVVLLVALLSSIFIAAPWMPEESPNSRTWTVKLIGPVMGCGFLILAACGVLRRDDVRIDALRGVAWFRWGWVPFVQQVEVPLNRLQLIMFERTGHSAGMTALELRIGTDRLLLAHAPWRHKLQPLYEQLAPFFAGRASDRTNAEFVPPRGPAGVISRTPIPITMHMDRDCTRYLHMQRDQAILRGAYGNTLALVIMAIGILLFAGFFNFTAGIPIWQSVNFFVAGLAAFVALLGLWIWPRTAVLRQNDWLHTPGCQWEGTWHGPLHASDIAAVQICVARMHESRRMYQVNLVANGPEVCRVNLICDVDPERVEEAAWRLADFFRVPVMSHW